MPHRSRRHLFASAVIVALAASACGSSAKQSGRSSAGLPGSTIPIVSGPSDRSSSQGAATTAAAAGATTVATGAATSRAGGAATTAAASADHRGAPATPPAGVYAPRPSGPYEKAPPAQNPTVSADVDNRSTFALDVDTASYTLARNHLLNGVLPDPSAVRTEEFVNFFDQGYDPATERGLTLRADGARVPFLPSSHRVVRVGVQGQTVAAGERKPANLTIVIDTSGSMGGEGKLDMVKAGLRRLVRSLRDTDTVELVTFSTDASVVLGRTHVSDGGEDRIMEVIDGLQPEASTNLEAGLSLGYRDAREGYQRGSINRVVLATDGVANTGATVAEQILAQVSEDAGKGIQLAAVGVGFGTYNDALLEKLADKGDGFYAYVDRPDEAERLFAERLTSTLQTVALDGKAEVRFNPEVVSTYRLLGYEDRAIPDGSLQDPNVGGGETGAGHVTTALYDVELRDDEAGAKAVVATAAVHWTDPDIKTGRDRTVDITLGDVSRDFGVATPRLRQDVWVAAFAERLRGGLWSNLVDMRQVARGLTQVADQLDGDSAVAELGRLVSTASSLRD